jgi:hypothetical protein
LLTYWVLFGYFAIIGLSLDAPQKTAGSRLAMLFGALLMTVLIGLRFEVGADWQSYADMFSYASIATFKDALQIGDPAYQIINWSVAEMNYGIWLVNCLCAAIFVWGLVRLASVQPSAFLAVVVAIPYLVIVVAMGYSRQAAAIGLIMAGLAAFDKTGSSLRFAAYVALAALFHKTAVVVLPLVIFAGRHNKFINLLAGVALTYGLYDVFLADSIDSFVKNYVDQQYSSQGAAIRVGMSLVPAAMCLFAGKRLGLTQSQLTIWRAFSLAAFAMLLALLLTPSSTAVDRIALYIIPLQLVVLSRVYLLFKDHAQGKVAVVLYSAVIQFTWLNFAAHARYWVPYQFYPLSV